MIIEMKKGSEATNDHEHNSGVLKEVLIYSFIYLLLSSFIMLLAYRTGQILLAKFSVTKI